MFQQIQEEAAMLKFGIEDALDAQGSANIYELMSATSQDITIKNSDSSEDIYESMLMIDPECAEDLCKIHTILFVALNNTGDKYW